MGRYFNTEAVCVPEKHYMVKLDDRLKRIREQYVDRGCYFAINRGRQYGKTTTLKALEKYLAKDYCVVSLDFQEIGTAEFESEAVFSQAFAQIFANELSRKGSLEKSLSETFLKSIGENPVLRILFERISELCRNSPKPIVLFIDEVDSASNNQVFLDFLALIRKYYINRDSSPAFQSVILAGVYDIKNLKLKIRPEKEREYNSLWNIAAEFNISMGFSPKQIAAMLQEYENDFHTKMDVNGIAGLIYEYTSGYPYLVSAICKRLDEDIPHMEAFEEKMVWSEEGIAEAVRILLNKSIPLFESMVKQMDQFEDLRGVLEDLIYRGMRIPYSPDVKAINIGIMFGFLKEEKGCVVISNRMFEMRLLNMFIAEEAIHSEAFYCGRMDSGLFTKNGRLNMDLVLQKFVSHYSEIYGDNDEKFIEKYGRKFFLLYLKPIINGTGNYYLEAHTRDEKRTDVIIDYLGEQFVVELKIWHGNEYNERGEEQLAGYLEAYNQKKGYMISFNFNKSKQTGVKQIQAGDKVIVEAVV